MDKESSRVIGMRLLALKTKQSIVSFLAPRAQPQPRLLLENNPGKCSAVRRSCFLPHSTDIDYKLLALNPPA